MIKALNYLHYKIYFRIPFFQYFIAKNVIIKKFCLMNKKFENGSYYFEEI